MPFIVGARDELYPGDLYHDWQVGMLVCAAAFLSEQAPFDCISHTWRLPWAYQPVISWLKSTMSHSVNIHSWWRHCSFTAVSRMQPANFLRYCVNVAQFISYVLIWSNSSSSVSVGEEDFKAQKRVAFWEIRERLMAAVNHFLAPSEMPPNDGGLHYCSGL